jgi:predicted transcriptional regulator
MSTTTIRLPDELKSRIARVTAHSKQTAHSFILEAIAEKAAQEEQRKDFQDVAEQRYANIVASGKTIPWADMRSYLEDKLAGKATKRPRAKKLAR